MWKLWHKLFGWEYVFIKNTATGMVRRVWLSPAGTPMVKPYYFQMWPLTGYKCSGWTITPLTPKVQSGMEYMFPSKD